jgi:phosphatidylinositol alpha-1,6-mannosyltransferase
MVQQRPRVAILASVDDSNFGLWLHRWFKLPFIVLAHGNEILSVMSERYEASLRALRIANRVVAVSRFTAKLTEDAGADPRRIELVHPGCDTRFFRPVPVRMELRQKFLGNRQARVILTVGNLVARKGHDMVIRALPFLSKRVPDVCYLIVGDGPNRNNLENLAKSLGVDDRVVFAGNVAKEQLPEVYALSDLFVMVSRERSEENDVEGFGLVFLEANACAKPVVAGRSGGVPDAVVDGVTGLLVDPQNVEAIALALEKVLTNDNLGRQLGEQGRSRTMRDFRWREVGERVLDILESVEQEGPITGIQAPIRS